MPYLWSPSERGFFHPEVHPIGTTPNDAIGISDAEHAELMRQQASGRRIETQSGRPVAVLPPEPEAAARPTTIPAAAFRARFTDAEHDRITVAAMEKATQGDASLMRFLLDTAAAVRIDLTDPAVVAAVDKLMGMQLLSPRRRDAILGA